MATEEEVIEVLEMLQAANLIERKASNPEAMVAMYLRKLSPYKAGTLRQAADAWIDGNNFFPTVHELVKLAESMNGRDWGTDLLARRFALTSVGFDLDAWRALATDFERAGRIDGAASIRVRIGHALAEDDRREYWRNLDTSLVKMRAGIDFDVLRAEAEREVARL